MSSSLPEKNKVNAQANTLVNQQSLFNLLSQVKLADKPRLKKRLFNLKKIKATSTGRQQEAWPMQSA